MQLKRLFLTLIVLFTLLLPNFTQAQQQEHPIVRLIYFVPRDRKPQPDINAKMDRLVKEVQQFYADQMEVHGHSRKTFQFETDAHGNAVVHHITGKFKDKYYVNAGDAYEKAWDKVGETFDTSQDIYLVVMDTSNERISSDSTEAGRATTIGYQGGLAAIPASGPFFNAPLAAHEIGHTFGLQHDFSSTDRIMSFGPWPWGPGGSAHLSKCAAEWLDVHPHFNTNQPRTADNTPTVMEMLPSSFVSAPNAIRLRFKITDANGLHQAQLLIYDDPTGRGMLGCKDLNGNQSSTVEFITTGIIPRDKTVFLRVIDVHGNATENGFPINITPLLPSPKPVSIPDVNLAAAVRKEIGDSITTQTMLSLLKLSTDRRITNLDGIEHAYYLEKLELHNDEPSFNDGVLLDLSPLAGLPQLEDLWISNISVSDVSALEGLTQLKFLLLHDNGLWDISPLAKLTQLKDLEISDNLIWDVSALRNLTQLEWLNLPDNNISDISPLAKLTKLTYLDLQGNPISDISVLGDLTQLQILYLIHNGISDVSPLAKLTKLTLLNLASNRISDVSALGNLTQLTYLSLSYNSIQDISPLVNLDLPGRQFDDGSGRLSDFPGLAIWNNPLSYASINTHIPAMQAKGSKIGFDTRAYPALAKLSGDGQKAAMGETLPKPFIVEVRNERGKPMPDVAVTFAITTGAGRLSSTIATTNAEGRARTTLTLGQTPGKHTVSVSARGIQSSVIFTATTTALIPSQAPADDALPSAVSEKPEVDTHTPTGPIDPSQPAIYWSGNGIQRANLDGSNVKPLVPEVDVLDITLDVTGGKMYWINYESIQRANLDGSNVETLVNIHGTQGISNLELMLDVSGGKMYWKHSKWGEGTSKIQRANLDGSNIETLVESGYVYSPTLDVSSGKIYWLDNIGIRRANLNGSNVENLARGDNPWQFTLDVARGKMYWLDNIGIRRANLNGSNIENLVWDRPAHYFTLDVSSGKIYWVGQNKNGNRSIQRANLDGTHIETLITIKDHASSITIDGSNRKMYWAGQGKLRSTIWRANLDGSNIEGITTFVGSFVLMPSQALADDASPAAVRKTTQVHVDAADRPPVYWIDTQAGTLHRLVEEEVENIVPSVRNANSLTLDVANKKLYWTEKTSNTTGRIRSANLDGTNVQLVKDLTSVPFDITFNPVDSKLYLTNSWGKVQRLNLDGSGFQPNLITGLEAPKHIAPNVSDNKIYWTEQTGDTTGRIQRANLNGSNIELVKELTSVPKGLTIDALNGKLYLTNSWGKVQRLNLNGTNFQSNLITDLNSPEDIAVDVAGGKLYWIEQDSIKCANLNGDNIQNVVTGLGTPANLVLGTAPVDAIVQAAPAAVIALPNGTRLHPNYPNPFNPETWIPYQLAESADVTLTIYDINGRVVQHLDLGHQRAGIYQSKARAAYWDGRNAQGEPVASGVYFYTLKAGDFSATKKMLIQK